VENSVMRSFFFLLIVIMVMGCAAKDPEPEPLITETTLVEAPPPEPAKERVAVTATRLNLRAEGTTASKVLHVLDNGEMLTVLARDNDWIRIQTDTGLEGWVAARYTRALDTIAPSTPSAPTAPEVPDQKPAEPSAAPPKTPEPTPTEPAIQSPPATTADTASSPAGDFSEKDAVAAYSRLRQIMADGDFQAFLNVIHDPPGPEEANAEEFAQLGGSLLEMMPDLANWKVRKFAREDDTALLVVRSDLSNPDNITLAPLFFFADEGQWKMQFDFPSETLPRQDPQADQANIAKALETNPALQLSGAPSAQPEPPAAPQSASPLPPPVAAVPSENGVAKGVMVINGEETELKFAYAYPESGFSDPDRMDTVAILSNMELDYEALSSWARRSELEDIGKLFCIELTINPDNQVISRRLRHHVFDGSPSGVSGSEVFEPQEAGQGIIAGQAYSTSEGEFFGVTYQYRAAFRAEIKEPVEPAESKQTAQASSYTITPPSKEDLTRVPRYMKDTAQPIFKTMDPRTLASGIKVVSNRNTAVFGFNTPEVVVYLPPFGNSAYAAVEFDDPRVVDGKSADVPFEVENGGYNEDTFSAEIRIIPEQGYDPLEFARVSGTGRIKYPLKVETQNFKPGETGSDVVFDGPFVTYTEKRDPDAPSSFTDVGPVRAYDATGGRLRKGDYYSTSIENNITRQTVTYRGNVTELQLDHPQQWVDIKFEYDLPPAAPKPESYSGRSATRPNPLVDTPGGKVVINLE